MKKNELTGTMFGLHEAIAEANRCLNCKKPTCMDGCPINNDIPEFIASLAQGDLGEARNIIARKSNLPAICGRVCAHELQCEGHCVLNKAQKPIRIGMLEQTIADFSFDMELPLGKVPQKNRGKIAVIGSGPAGLTVAGDLAKIGFNVTVFEALEEPGGVLLYGIPSFRLSKKVVRREIKGIENLGVNFRTNCVVGPDINVDQLFEQGFDAVFIGSGTAVSKDLDLPGKDLDGIMQSSYLLRMNYLYRSQQIEMKDMPIKQQDRVLVIGAGNVAMDAARTAKLLGAESVTIISRGSKESMSALQSEFDAAIEEGVQALFDHSPLAFIGDDSEVSALRVIHEGRELDIAADKILLAVGTRPSNRIVSTTSGIKVDEDGYVMMRKRPYGMTTRKGVFAGGDVVHRPATVVLAMKEAKQVAVGIAEYVDAVKLLVLSEYADDDELV